MAYGPGTDDDDDDYDDILKGVVRFQTAQARRHVGVVCLGSLPRVKKNNKIIIYVC